MNVILKTDKPGFIENEWVGYTLGLGESAQLSLAMLDARCVMVTLAQDDLAKDTEVLRALVCHNRIKLGDLGNFPCAGIYAVVVTSGSVKLGDQVVLN